MTAVIEQPPKPAAKVTNMRTALSDHARERAAERTDMTPEAIIDLLHTGRAVQLNNPDRHAERRAYFLCFSQSNKQFFVAVTAPADDARKSGTLVTILSLEQHETDRGEINFETKCRAARLTMTPADYQAFKAELAKSCDHPSLLAKRDIRVALFYFDTHQNRRRLMLGGTRVPLRHLVEHGLASIHTHPAFWAALSERVASAEISENVTIDCVEVWAGDSEPVVITLEELMAGRVQTQTEGAQQ
jgi:hypothetical protein